MENKISKEEIEKIKQAIYATSSLYSTKQTKDALKNLILKDDVYYFTRKDNARKNILEIGIENVKNNLIKEYIKSVINDSKTLGNPLEEAIKRTYLKYKDTPKVDVLEAIEELLKKCLNEEVNSFTRDNDARGKLDRYSYLNDKKLSEIVADAMSQKLTENMFVDYEFKRNNIKKKEPTNKYIDSEKELKISNIQIHSNNIEQLRSAIISGTRIQREGTISLGKDLQACSSIGNIRKNQEDAVLLIRHPKNPDFKMMVVADGMGGLEAGEEASNKVVTDIQSWFETLDISYYENMDGLEENLGQVLQIISDEINSKYGGRAGATFVGAIIGKDETLISNVGDSRAYTVSGTSLEQITEDHSRVNDLYKRGMIERSDDMRFHKDSNRITQSMGLKIIRPSFYKLSNYEYDAIMLFSDGVTDCLSDEQLYAITMYTDRSKLAETIVKGALSTTTTKPSRLNGNDDYKPIINAGKDNTTAAVYTNQRKRELNRELYSNYPETPPPSRAGVAKPIIRNGQVQLEEENEIELQK